MQLLTEQLGPKANTSDIRSPDDRGVAVWMVSPSGVIKQIFVAKNKRTGVLEISKGNVVLTGEAQAKGWRYLKDVHGDKAVRDMDTHQAKCKQEGAKPERPKFFAESMDATKNNDGEPPEGRHRAAKALEVQKANAANAERMAQLAKPKAKAKPAEKVGE